MRARWTTPIYLALGLLAAMMPLGCKTSNDKLIRFVSSLPRTGSAKAQTDSIVHGIEMALEEAGHKVGDFAIDYQDKDDATAALNNWTAEAEAANARNAASDQDVMVYLGPYNSGAAQTSIPILNAAGLLMISPAVTNPSLTKPGTGAPDEPAKFRKNGINFLRVVPTDDLQASVGAKLAKELGAKQVYILDDNEVYGKGIADIFRKQCEKLGITVLGQDSIDRQATDFKATMIKIKGLNPDLVYFGGTTQNKGGQVARDMYASGIACPILVPDGCYETAFIEAAGAKELEGRCYVTFGGLPPQEQLKGAGKEFIEKYKAKYNKDPEVYAIYGYEAAKVAVDAVRRAGKKDRDAIRQAALNTKDFHGALGTWSFDENGDTTNRVMSISVVRNGDFQYLKSVGD